MNSIYLDYMATTPVDPIVLKTMLPYFSEHFGNPSALNAYGKTARDAVEFARAQVAKAMMTEPSGITFTSGATEANNLAIFGLAAALPPHKRHIVTLATEHKSVLAPYERLAQQGYEVSFIKPQADGLVDLKTFAAALRPNTGLVSVMWVNNEIGVIQPIAELCDIVRQHEAAVHRLPSDDKAQVGDIERIYLHVDAVQGLGKVDMNLATLDVDAVVISGHKIYGPKGVGALWLRDGLASKVQPMCMGGGQEQGLRAGTLAVPFIVGMGKACELVILRQQDDWQHAMDLRHAFLAGLAKLGDWDLNGSLEYRVPHNLNISFTGIDSETLRLAVPSLSLSAGSACQVGKMQASHVLKALDLPIQRCQGAVRISFGRHTTLVDIATATDMFITAVNRLRVGAGA